METDLPMREIVHMTETGTGIETAGREIGEGTAEKEIGIETERGIETGIGIITETGITDMETGSILRFILFSQFLQILV